MPRRLLGQMRIARARQDERIRALDILVAQFRVGLSGYLLSCVGQRQDESLTIRRMSRGGFGNPGRRRTGKRRAFGRCLTVPRGSDTPVYMASPTRPDRSFVLLG